MTQQCLSKGGRDTTACLVKIGVAWLMPFTVVCVAVGAHAVCSSTPAYSNNGENNTEEEEESVELGSLETPGFGNASSPSFGRAVLQKKRIILALSAAPILLSVLRSAAVSSYGADESTAGESLIVVLDGSAKGMFLYLVLLAMDSGKRATDRRRVVGFLTWIAAVFLFASIWDLAHYSHEGYMTMLFPILNSILFASMVTVCGRLSLQDSTISSLFLLFRNSLYPRLPKYTRISEYKQWPEYTCHLLSRISFSWMNDLISLAVSRPLVAADLWDLDENDKGATIYSQFARLTNQTGYIRGTLLKILLRINFNILTYEYGISLIDHVFIFGGPFFINAILTTIETPNAKPIDILKPVGGLLLASLLRTTCESQLYWVNRRIDARIRASLVGAIYMKGLTRMQPATASALSESLQNASSKPYSDGAVSNLMSADTDKILACFRQSHYLLSVPFLLILCCSLLVKSVGWAGAIAGMMSLSLAVPATKTVGKRIKKHRKELMRKSDTRISKLNEILNGIKTLKLFAWESHFHTEIEKARSTELESLHSYLDSNMLTQLIWRCSPLLASGVTFLVRALVSKNGETVDAATAFTVLAMYNNVLRYPLFVIPKLAISVMELNVSLGRIEDFLVEPDLERFSPSLTSVGSGGGNSNDITCMFSGNAAFNYGGASNVPVVEGFDFEFPNGKLTTIIGKSGTGKSTLLLALLGELKTLNGRVTTPANHTPKDNSNPHPISYAPQAPFLTNTSIKENILFGNKFDQQRYNRVLFACALLPDLETFPQGDETPVGERGAALSGGQRQRISLARAIYAPSRVLLLDDVLSALDANTARHVVENCLLSHEEFMQGRTRILVTHACGLCLPVSDYVCVMGFSEDRRGVARVVSCGSLERVVEDSKRIVEVKVALDAAVGGVVFEFSGAGKVVVGAVENAILVPESSGSAVSIKAADKTKPPKEDLVTTGKPSIEAYKFYLSAAGGLHSGVLFILSILTAYVFGFLHDYTLKLWSDKSKAPHDASSSQPLLLYAGSVVLAISALYARFKYQIYFSSQASHHISQTTFSRLLNAPLSFYDTTPQGKIMNRFGKDTQVLDQEVSSSIGETTQQCIHGIMVSLMISFASPILLVFAIPIGYIYLPIAKKFMSVTRSLKKLESSTRSPVYTAFGETLAGAVTIRAFGKQESRLSHLLATVDAHHRAFLPLWGVNRWLAFRVETVGALVAFGTGASLALTAAGENWGGVVTGVDPGWAGLVLNYAGMFTDVLTWLVRNSAQMEMTMTSVERLQEYTFLEQERPSVVEGRDVASSWPSNGAITIENLGIKYNRDAPLAVDIPRKLTISSGESVGIVGRTGSGKSTLGMSFVRFVEYTRGTILIDGVDISSLGLRDLRKNLVIIPQDPFLFTGTVQSNLDPTSMYSRNEVQSALDRVMMNEDKNAHTLSLDTLVS
ncbi:UNVERIFIED_CONTAM: hypothetical protein HDU68_000103 [Siphonaria sp. JEL0065]|nr:hypothetical protein HDU68_000103 [Siphonaria sp. JEL0065]